VKVRPLQASFRTTAVVVGISWLLACACCVQADDSGPSAIEPREPPTPPAATSSGTDLVDSMPQEPGPDGVRGLAPGTVARLVAAQTPKPVEVEEPGEEAGPEKAVKAGEDVEPTVSAAIPRGSPGEEDRTTPANNSPSPETTTPVPAPKAPVPPAPSAHTPAATSLPPMRVATATVATAIVDRQPQGASDHFPEGTKVHCFTAIVNEGGGHRKIRHRWMHDGQVKAQVKLNVKASQWRTWSVIPVYGHGKWQVDIVDEAGVVLKSVPFRVE